MRPTCDEVITAMGLERFHCESCHEDADNGDGPMAVMLCDDDQEIEVCCEVARAIAAKLGKPYVRCGGDVVAALKTNG